MTDCSSAWSRVRCGSRPHPDSSSHQCGGNMFIMLYISLTNCHLLSLWAYLFLQYGVLFIDNNQRYYCPKLQLSFQQYVHMTRCNFRCWLMCVNYPHDLLHSLCMFRKAIFFRSLYIEFKASTVYMLRWGRMLQSQVSALTQIKVLMIKQHELWPCY